MLAVNAPKKYPKEPITAQQLTAGAMTETDEAKISALFGALTPQTGKQSSTSTEAQEAAKN